MSSSRAALSLVLLLLSSLASPGQALFQQVRLQGNFPVGDALQQIAAQTGVRFTGLAGLTAAAPVAWNLDRLLPAALREVATRGRVLLTRTGLYDYLVRPQPEIPPTPGPAAEVGGLTVRVYGRPHYPFGPDGQSYAVPQRLVVDLHLEADDELAVAAVQRYDVTSLKLVGARGSEQPVLTTLLRPSDPRRRRMGFGISLPFGPPDDTTRTVTLQGDLWRYQQVEPLGFEIDVAAVGDHVDRGGLTLSFLKASPTGMGWVFDLALTRPVTLGEDEPWLEAAVRGEDRRLYRPSDITFSPLAETPARPAKETDDAPADERVSTLCRLIVPLPEQVKPARLHLQWVQRRRPWDKVSFTIPNIELPAPRVLSGSGGRGRSKQDGS